ncbi:MAG: tRNA (5-methylaminomethyl-2-thiouridine)(34)-methyltransferase MnmD [Cytophagales bacterium]|nr:tRNA (5-methylaminomethyl-2-thiouridine)(34)-methyltransferase MnmD [Cytophagales bacterium]
MMPLKIITTEDGSQSLYDDELNETYHSTKGARGESIYIFIEKGLEFLLSLKTNHQLPISILEVGFGTGLNALLVWDWADRNKRPIHFSTLEPFPVPEEIWNEMDLMSDPRFEQLHRASWNEQIQLSLNFELGKSKDPLEDLGTKNQYDVIFFDAFAPSKQPEIWTIENLQRCYESLRQGGILTTYCAQGQFKRNLASVGFKVEVLPGALGKKEMVRGRK